MSTNSTTSVLDVLPLGVRHFAERLVDERRALIGVLEAARSTDARFAGEGRYEYEVALGRAFAERAEASLAHEAKFRRAAESAGANADAILDALGGLAALRPSGAAEKWMRENDARWWATGEAPSAAEDDR